MKGFGLTLLVMAGFAGFAGWQVPTVMGDLIVGGAVVVGGVGLLALLASAQYQGSSGGSCDGRYISPEIKCDPSYEGSGCSGIGGSRSNGWQPADGMRHLSQAARRNLSQEWEPTLNTRTEQPHWHAPAQIPDYNAEPVPPQWSPRPEREHTEIEITRHTGR